MRAGSAGRLLTDSMPCISSHRSPAFKPAAPSGPVSGPENGECGLAARVAAAGGERVPSVPARVYVIELDRGAGRRRDPRIPWVYVGSSARDAELRLAEHRRGYRVIGLVQAVRGAAAPRPRGPAGVPGVRPGTRGRAERAIELAGCGFVAHSDGNSYGKGQGCGRNGDCERLDPCRRSRRCRGRSSATPPSRRSTPAAAPSCSTRGSRLLGRRLHRPGRSAFRLRPFRSRLPHRSPESSRAGARAPPAGAP